jgi:hypothetical protein
MVLLMIILYQKIYFILLDHEDPVTYTENMRLSFDESLALMLMGNDHAGYSLQLYIYWFIGLLVFPVVFMNLLITVIGDIMGQTQDKQADEAYREKVSLVLEVESNLFFFNRK